MTWTSRLSVTRKTRLQRHRASSGQGAEQGGCDVLDFDRAVFTRRRRVARHVLHPRSGYCDRAVLTRTGRARRSPGKKKESLPGEAGEDHSLERRAIGHESCGAPPLSFDSSPSLCRPQSGQLKRRVRKLSRAWQP